MKNRILLLLTLLLAMASSAHALQLNPDGLSYSDSNNYSTGTIATASGTLTGVSGQAAYFTGTNAVSGNTGYLYDSVANRLSILSISVTTLTASSTLGTVSATYINARQVSGTNVSATNLSYTTTGSRCALTLSGGGLLGISTDFICSVGNTRASAWALNKASVSAGYNADISGTMQVTSIFTIGVSGTNQTAINTTSVSATALTVSGTGITLKGVSASLVISGTAGTAPVTCGAATEGYISYSFTNHYLCVCDGTSWKQESLIGSVCTF